MASPGPDVKSGCVTPICVLLSPRRPVRPSVPIEPSQATARDCRTDRTVCIVVFVTHASGRPILAPLRSRRVRGLPLRRIPLRAAWSCDELCGLPVVSGVVRDDASVALLHKMPCKNKWKQNIIIVKELGEVPAWADTIHP